jgi:GNAT superfamily N-acetyltransferase
MTPVPVVEGPGDQRVLLDADGTPVGRYDHDERNGVVYADLFLREPGISAERAAAAVLTDLRGMRVAGDEALGSELVAAGGQPLRHAHLLSHDMAERPALPELPGYRLTHVDRPATELMDAFLAAYPPGHPDHRVQSYEQALAPIDGYVRGREFGGLLHGSGLAVAPDGRVAGAILIGTLPGDPPLNGPWIIELFRHPAHRGVGRALLERALAIAPVPALGLMVTEGNPARRLYEALGFRRVVSFLVVQI